MTCITDPKWKPRVSRSMCCSEGYQLGDLSHKSQRHCPCSYIPRKGDKMPGDGLTKNHCNKPHCENGQNTKGSISLLFSFLKMYSLKNKVLREINRTMRFTWQKYPRTSPFHEQERVMDNNNFLSYPVQRMVREELRLDNRKDR